MSQGFLDALSQLHRVRIGLLLNAQDHGGLAVQPRIAALDGWCKHHGGHFTELDRPRAFPYHRQALQIFNARGAANVANQVLARVQL